MFVYMRLSGSATGVTLSSLSKIKGLARTAASLRAPRLPIPGHHRRREADNHPATPTVAPRLTLSALSWTVPVPEPPGSSISECVISLRQRYNHPINHDSQNNEGISDAA